jgi:hypothetical protein
VSTFVATYAADSQQTRAIPAPTGENFRLIDLCRYRDYADIAAGGGVNALFWLGFWLVSRASLSA